MKKVFLSVILFLSLSAVAQAAVTSASQISTECLTTPATCNAEENAYLDGLKATPNSDKNNQGQAAQLNNQGKNALANPATQYQTTVSDQATTRNTSTPGACTECNLGYVPLEPVPGLIPNGNNLNFSTLLGSIYRIAIAVGALFSVLMLTISGIRYMLSDVVTDKERAKLRIRACLYGLVLIAASWLILNTINPQLVNFKFNPGSGSVVTPSGPNVGVVPTPAQTAQQRAAELQKALAYCATLPPQLMIGCNAAVGAYKLVF